MQYQAAIFDMDGTILDTLTDLNRSLNYALAQTGHRSDWTPEDTKACFGSGIRVAIQRALAMEQGFPRASLDLIGTEAEPPLNISEEEIERVRTVYAPHYQRHCNDHTGPYPGVPQLLAELRRRGIRTAVVSNKPDGAVKKLVEELFPGCFDFSLGETPGLRRKPAPDMVRRCLEEFGLGPEQAVYIGDSEVDLQTARNTGLPCIAVDWGFRGRAYLEKQGAERIVSTCGEIMEEMGD